MRCFFLLTLNLLHGLLSTEVQDPDNSHSRLSTTTISLEEESGKPSLKRQSNTDESLKRQNTTEEVIRPKKHEPWIVPVAAFGVVGCLVGFAMAGWLLEEFFFYEKGIGQTILFAIVLLFIVVGGYVGHAEVIKLEPRVAGNHSVLMAILDMGSFGMLFPFGLYMYGPHKVKQILLPTLFLAVVQLASYICWVHSFQYLSVASYSIIVQISPVVIYPMEILLLKQRFLISKLLLVMLGVGGLLLIFVSHKTKSDGKEEMLYGYVLCTVGVLLLCVYQISYSMLIPALPASASSGENIRFQTFFLGLRGALIAIIAVPLYALYFVMNDTYRKKFNDGFPNESEVTVMFGAVMINWCWNYGAQIALVKFAALWLAMACSLSIPVSVFIDTNLNKLQMSFGGICGSLIILASFLGLTYVDYLGSSAPHVTEGRGEASQQLLSKRKKLTIKQKPVFESTREPSSLSEGPVQNPQGGH